MRQVGWWHPNTNSGRVHDHPVYPGRGWSVVSHRLRRPVGVAEEAEPRIEREDVGPYRRVTVECSSSFNYRGLLSLICLYGGCDR